MKQKARKLNVRGFVAMMITLSGLGLPITGIANHLHQFESMTVARHAWMSAHNILGLTFAIFVIWHAALNRRALWNHMKGAVAHIPALNREAALAGVILGLLLLISVGHAFHVAP